MGRLTQPRILSPSTMLAPRALLQASPQNKGYHKIRSIKRGAGENCFLPAFCLYLKGYPIDEYDDYGFKGDPGDPPSPLSLSAGRQDNRARAAPKNRRY